MEIKFILVDQNTGNRYGGIFRAPVGYYKSNKDVSTSRTSHCKRVSSSMKTAVSDFFVINGVDNKMYIQYPITLLRVKSRHRNCVGK